MSLKVLIPTLAFILFVGFLVFIAIIFQAEEFSQSEMAVLAVLG